MFNGATWYSRVSRNLRSMSYSAAKPNPPWVSRQALAAAHEASLASSFDMFASVPHGFPASNRSAAFLRIRSAALSDAYAFASGNWTPWFAPIGRPNTSRVLA